MGNGISAPIVPTTVFSPLSVVSLIHTQSIQNLLSGSKWGNGIGNGSDLSYSFSNYASLFNYTTLGMFDLKLMTATQKSAAQSAMQMWANVANITFNEVMDTSVVAGDIRWNATTSFDISSIQTLISPNSASNGDIWIGANYGGYNSSTAGSYSMYAYMHELGHALGLAHPNESTIAPVSNEDQLKYSIMSYRSFAGDSTAGTYGNSFFPTTPMINDIAAIQFLYGANTNNKTGNDVYSWVDGQNIFETIWDGGGNDTIDASNQTQGVVIQLTSGKWSSIGGSFWNGQGYVRDCLTIAYDTVIENATGSNLADQLEGNDAANMLQGLGGNDILDGGAGDDTAVFIGNMSEYSIVKNVDGSITVTDIVSGRDGSDILRNIEHIKFLDATYHVNDTVVIPLGNSAPTSQNTVVVTNEDTAKVFSVSDFPFFDADNGDILTKIMITSLPSTGTLKLNGSAVILNQEITTVDISLGKLVFTPEANGNGAGYASFGFKVSDGIVYSGMNNTVTINVTPINDLPAGSVTITGNSVVGQTLTAANTLTDADGMGIIQYHWYADGVAIVDAIQAAYTLTNNEIGKAITVQASYTDAQGTFESLFSSATASVMQNIVIGVTPGNDTPIEDDEDIMPPVLMNVINGTSGNDTLIGDNSDNIIDGKAGADKMIGNLGNDTYFVDSVKDVVIETSTLKTEIDMVYSSVRYVLGNNVENLILIGENNISGTGNSLDNILIGNKGNNLLDGKSGSDLLHGGDGNDYLIGGTGNDTLIGGNGKDVFLFNTTLNSKYNRDIILDFESGEDKIQLENAIFKKLIKVGTLTSANFVANETGTAKDSNDYIVYNTKTGVLTYDTNGSYSGGVVEIAVLGVSDHPSISYSDFMVS